MSEGIAQRVYLTCGSVFLLVFCFATALAIVKLGTGVQVEVLAVIMLATTMAILLFNSTLLFGGNGGPKVLSIGKALLWVSFLLIAAAIMLCIVSMAGSL